MKKNKQITAIILSLTLALGLSACSNGADSSDQSDDPSGSSTGQTISSTEQVSNDIGENIEPSVDPEREYIEQTLNLACNEEQEWAYSKDSDAWTLSIVSAVAYPELPDQQGVSVCVPGAYVSGIDTDGDGNADVTAQSVSNAVKGSLVIDYDATITSTNGQIYSASTAPVIVNTGAAGYGSQNNSDFYDYQIEAGAVGVYQNSDGGYSTSVNINGENYEISDGLWGCVAYSAITSLYEADMALAFEYYLDSDYSFKTTFQAQLAEYLSESYMEYINAQNLSAAESAVGFDLNKDGDTDDVIDLKIEYDLEAHADTNGYYGTYLDLYLAEFTENLQWYLDNLDYSDGWTWFDENGNAYSDSAVAAMTSEDKARAFIEGRYAKSSSGGMKGGPGGNMPGGMATDGDMPGGTPPDGNMPGGDLPDGDAPGGAPNGGQGNEMIVGTPDGGTMQSATGKGDSTNYESYSDMAAAYKADIDEIYSGDKYGKNIVSLYNPLNYIGADGTEDPVWTRIVMGASEGDMSMFSSLNLQIAWLNANVDSVIEWQWDGGHVPSDVLGESLSLYVDTMYGKYVDGAVKIEKEAPTKQTENGSSESATGSNISSWVNYDDITAISFTLADAAAYRTAGASKATPGFDVIDYGQEDYVFGNSEKDARHWNIYLLEIFEKYGDVLEPLFNSKS